MLLRQPNGSTHAGRRHRADGAIAPDDRARREIHLSTIAKIPSVAGYGIVELPTDLCGLPIAGGRGGYQAKDGRTTALRTHCREALAPYKVPKEITVMGALPRNATGKIMRRALRDDAG